jgi:hypothetical protein
VPTDNEQPQRSNSNAAKTAKLFGYAATAQAKIDEEAAQAPQTEAKAALESPNSKAVWTKIEKQVQPVPTMRNTPTKLISALEAAPQKTELPKKGKPSISKLDDLMSTLEIGSAATQKLETPEPGPQEWKKGPKRGKPSISQLDDLMSMLETNPAPLEKAKVPKKGKPSISQLDDLMNILETHVTVSKESSVQDRGTTKSAPGASVVEVKPWIKTSFVYEPAPITILAEPTGRIQAVTIPSPVAEAEKEEEYTGPTILDYQRMSDQIKLEQEQMELARKRMLEEEEKFETEEKRLAEEDEMMKQFVAEVEREQARIREEEEAQERERQLGQESDYGDSEVDERDSFDRLDDDRLAQEEADYQNSQVRIYEEEVEAERLKYDEEEENARLEAQRIEGENFAKQQRRAEEERIERLRYKEETRVEEARLELERIARQRKRDAKERERLRIEEEEARLEDERIEDERRAWRERRAEKEREERLRLEEEERLEAQRMEDARMAEERRIEEEQEERLRYEEAAKLEAQRMQEERMAQQKRVEQERAAQLANEEESDDEPLDKEAQLRKAEYKIRAAFAGLAKERGQLPGNVAIAVPREESPVGNGVKPAVNKLKVGRVGVGLDVARAERGVSRYNTVAGGGRPQVPEKSPVVARVNTVVGRLGLPNGPRGGGLPSGPRAGLPSGPRPKR